jgi:hypothetical protein
MIALALLGACARADREERADKPGMTEGERVTAAQGLSGKDAAVKAEVDRKLSSDTLTGSQRVSVEAHDGVVTLSGRVDQEPQRGKAEELAQQVDGVERVDNRIAVGAGPAAPPAGNVGGAVNAPPAGAPNAPPAGAAPAEGAAGGR